MPHDDFKPTSLETAELCFVLSCVLDIRNTKALGNTKLDDMSKDQLISLVMCLADGLHLFSRRYMHFKLSSPTTPSNN